MKIIAIVWQSYYNMLLKASKRLKDIIDIKVYSARALESDPERLNRVLDELINSADLVFLYRSIESFWDKVEGIIREKENKPKIVCLSHDPAYWTLSTVRPEVVSRAYAYLVVNGEENMTNMLKFLASEELGLSLDYDPPKEIPWEGLYHPRADGVFTDIESFLDWYDGYWSNKTSQGTVGILFSRHYWINNNLDLENLLIDSFERKGLKVIPAFAYSVKDDVLGTKGSGDVVLEWFMDKNGKPRIDAMVKLIPFFLGFSKDGGSITNTDVASDGVEILKKLDVPCFSPVSSYYKTVEE